MVQGIRLDVATHADRADPKIAALSGAPVVAVRDDATSDPGADGFTGIYGAMFASSGRMPTPEISFSSAGGGARCRSTPQVAALKGGSAVAWQPGGPDARDADDGHIRPGFALRRCGPPGGG